MENYHVGDAVMCGIHGVCHVTEISVRAFCGEKAPYYTLKPIMSAYSTLYLPVGKPQTASRMRPLMDGEKIDALLRELPRMASLWTENASDRKDRFAALIKRNDPSEFAALVKTLYRARADADTTGKKMHAADERALADAERLLFDEISFVLGLPREDVAPMFRRALEAAEG